MRPPLRHWQSEAIPAALEALAQGRHGIVHACTGAGKSVVIAEIIARWLHVDHPGRVVVTVPSVFLVWQLADALQARLVIPIGRYFTGAKDTGQPVIVACNPSAVALAGVLQGGVSLWIVDEAHRSEAASMRAACDALRPAHRIGFTATPYRSLPTETVSLFDTLLYEYPIGRALEDGVLVPFRVVTWDGAAGTRTGETDAVMAGMIRDHAIGPGIVSARSIADAEQYAELLSAVDIPAEAIHSELSARTRTDLLERLRTGALRCLVHCALLAEGVDYPWLMWLGMRRRVSARVRLVQELGRVLRCAPGKVEAIILDPHDLLSRHGIAHAAALGDVEYRPDDELGDDGEEWPLLDLPPVRLGRMPRAVAIDAVGAWTRHILLQLQLAGLYRPDPWSATVGGEGAKWRRERATPKQMAALGRLAWAARLLPREHQEAMRAVCAATGLRRGIASDAMTILGSAATGHREDRRWQWSARMDVPGLPDRVIAALEAGNGR